MVGDSAPKPKKFFCEELLRVLRQKGIVQVLNELAENGNIFVVCPFFFLSCRSILAFFLLRHLCLFRPQRSEVSFRNNLAR